jgi:hypothetical protein
LNHFAHARVASAHASDPLLALGAMLPDFAGFLRERLAALGHPRLSEGLRLHHASDAVLHAAKAFREPVAAGAERLAALGVARGPARGAAHVGVELLLDAALAHEREAAARYADALEQALRPEIDAAIAWRRAEAAPRWRALHARLVARGAPDPGAGAAELARAVARTLATRPRLALDARGVERVERWLDEVRAEVDASAPALLAQVLAATSAPRAPLADPASATSRNGAQSSAFTVCVSGASKPSRPYSTCSPRSDGVKQAKSRSKSESRLP